MQKYYTSFLIQEFYQFSLRKCGVIFDLVQIEFRPVAWLLNHKSKHIQHHYYIY